MQYARHAVSQQVSLFAKFKEFIVSFALRRVTESNVLKIGSIFEWRELIQEFVGSPKDIAGR